MTDKYPNELERKAQKLLIKELAPLPELSTTVDALIQVTLRSIELHPTDTPSCKVGLILISRFANDARACTTVGQLGYGLQALATTAQMMEILGALSYVGTDDARARAWAEHSNRKRTFPDTVRQGIEATLSALGALDSVSRDEWRTGYESACMAKHANPRLALFQGLRRASDTFDTSIGPDTTAFGVFLSGEAFNRAISYGSAVVVIGSVHCTDLGVRKRLQYEARKARAEMISLEPFFARLQERVRETS